MISSAATLDPSALPLCLCTSLHVLAVKARLEAMLAEAQGVWASGKSLAVTGFKGLGGILGSSSALSLGDS